MEARSGVEDDVGGFRVRVVCRRGGVVRRARAKASNVGGVQRGFAMLALSNSSCRVCFDQHPAARSSWVENEGRSKF